MVKDHYQTELFLSNELISYTLILWSYQTEPFCISLSCIVHLLTWLIV